MTRNEWLHAGMMVLTGAGVLVALALLIRVVSDDLGLMFLYNAGLAAVAGGVCQALVFLVGRAGDFYGRGLLSS